ncbi:MAG: antibiotic biosynthesis monooxygenase [Terracidiphilus sp.]|nr:antibiotic biosynthesis monooxygenase [Terracidiphilus sp.]
MPFASTPEPPYFAVIFTSLRAEGDHGYSAMADKMVEFASAQPGFLGIESARDNLGITVSYWRSLEDIAAWKAHAEHKIARDLGREQWYRQFQVRICRVERAYSFTG